MKTHATIIVLPKLREQSIWNNRCPNGEDTDCPGGQGCYGNTGCFYSEDLVPTETPIAEPTAGPSTLPPVEYSDASNTRYCVSYQWRRYTACLRNGLRGTTSLALLQSTYR